MTFALRRIFVTLLVLWGVCTATFLLLHIIPGDPVDIMLGDNARVEDKIALRHDLGLDQPLGQQYLSFFSNLSRGELGQSFRSQKPITTEISDHLPPTFELAFSSMLFALIVGLPLGILAAVKKYTWMDHLIEGLTLTGLSLPSFFLAPLLIIVFSIKLDLLPVSERNEGWGSLILPAVSLGFGLSAVLIRMTRASFLEVLNEDYIRTARAKGLQEKIVFFKHALKNALTPIVTVISLQFGAVLTGVVITETIFDWPGLGILFYNSLQSRDYPLAQACVLCIAVIYVLVNLLTDFAYVWVNPRLRA